MKNGAEIYLIGTAHVSAKSALEVERVIRAVKPSTVMVELDKERATRLMVRRHVSHPSCWSRERFG